MEHNKAAAGRRVVIKLGTSTLTRGSGRLDRAQMLEIVRAAATLRRRGHKVLLVSSGAMAAGREVLGNPQLPALMSSKQLLASVGQSRLMSIWENLFAIYGICVGQILLTRADLENRERFLNAKDALTALLDHDIVPVINENDAVSTQEIKVGDNDNMAALTGILCDADCVILLTDQQGLYSADPRRDPSARLIERVAVIDKNIEALAGGAGTAQGTGGMATKVHAAKIAAAAGIELIIASGDDPALLLDLVEGRGRGTFFAPAQKAQLARKIWLGAAVKAAGTIVVDAGAAQALCRHGSSLLPTGVKGCRGDFVRGAVVEIADQAGLVIAQGMTRYSAEELGRIMGHQSDEIEGILGYSHGSVVMHRDDLVLRD